MDISMISVVVAVVIGVAVGAYSFTNSRARKRAFEMRQSSSANDIFDLFYADSGLDRHDVVRLWQACAKKLRIPPDKLRPTDRFDVELSVRDFWATLDDPRDDLAAYVRTHAKEMGLSVNLQEIKTVDELIRAMAKGTGHL